MVKNISYVILHKIVGEHGAKEEEKHGVIDAYRDEIDMKIRVKLYENKGFFDETLNPGNVLLCGNRAASQATAFDTVVQRLLTDLVVATPRINSYFAASTRVVVGADLTVYAVAQCAQTVSSSGCLNCLRVAQNIQSCPPLADARAADVGCFLRYSDTSFFPANQTTNITPFLGGGN
ncbi:hypothetical protein LguiB_012403 [Lonicera macranthoides]